MARHGTTFEQRLRLDEEHQQLVAMDGFLCPNENGLGGSARERRVMDIARNRNIGLQTLDDESAGVNSV